MEKNFWIDSANKVWKILKAQGYDDEQISKMKVSEIINAVKGTIAEPLLVVPRGSKVAMDIIATLKELLKTKERR